MPQNGRIPCGRAQRFFSLQGFPHPPFCHFPITLLITRANCALNFSVIIIYSIYETKLPCNKYIRSHVSRTASGRHSLNGTVPWSRAYKKGVDMNRSNCGLNCELAKMFILYPLLSPSCLAPTRIFSNSHGLVLHHQTHLKQGALENLSNGERKDSRGVMPWRSRSHKNCNAVFPQAHENSI